MVIEKKEFYLILIKENGEIIHNIFASSHKDLIQKYINSDEERNTYIKATYSPPVDGKLHEIEKYQLILNQNYIPDWFTEDVNKNVVENLKNIITSMIITGRKSLLLHEGAILSGNAHVDELKHSVVFGMYDNARVRIVDNGSEIHEMTDNTIVDEIRDNGKIINVWGFAKIKEMYDYSKVMKMFGQAKVGIMHDNSRICILKGDSNIMEMHNMSQADRLKHMSKVDEMHGHSVIEEMWDWTVVEKMFDNSKINYMDEESRVLEMYGDSMVDEMAGSAIVEALYENSLVRKLFEKAKILKKELGELPTHSKADGMGFGGHRLT